MRFTKVNGLGNDYCVFDLADSLEWTGEQWSALARLVSNRTTGVGSDGILVIGPGEARDDCVTVASMRIFNADGSPGEMCGNGLRCVGKLLAQRGRARIGGSQGFVISTDAGPRTLWIDPDKPNLVRTTLGHARLGPEAVGALTDRLQDIEPIRLVAIGNPHAIVLVDEPLTDADLARRGAVIENADAFPDRINAQFARIINRAVVGLQSWERGAGATKACGTGAAAVVAGLYKEDLVDRKVVVTLPGGDLTIEIGTDGEIFQIGPAEIEFDGDWLVG